MTAVPANDDDNRFMQAALVEGEKALAQGYLPVGAVLVQNGQIISRAHKTMASSLLDHAETNLLRSSLQGQVNNRQSITLYTTLEPCLMCFGTIRHCSLGRLVYAMEDAYGGASGLPDQALPVRHHSRPIEVRGGVMREDARHLFKRFLATTKEAFWVNGGALEFQAAVKAP